MTDIWFGLRGIAILIVVFAANPRGAFADDRPARKTTVDIARDEYGGVVKLPKVDLSLLIKPLTREELEADAKAWIGELQKNVAEISRREVEVKRDNRRIEEAEKAAEELKEAAEDAASGATTQPEAAATTQPAEAAVRAAEQEAAAKTAEKETKLVSIVQLREDRVKLRDRTNIVLAELKLKGGDIDAYESYVGAVTTTKIDVADAAEAWVSIRGWITSEEGGVRWLKNFLLFVGTLLAFWILARIIGRGVRRGVRMMKGVSDLMRDFIVGSTRRVVVIIGLIVALAQLEVEISPLLAAIGAAGFVVAFALQGTLSNFASGILILFYRPYDVGDIIEVAGVSGTVRSMNLMTTIIETFDNKRVIVPNNSIWGNVITNITGNPTRRVDMKFGIGYRDDADKAKAILEDVLATHPLVLKEPEPVVRIHELADSSVNLICRPWSKTPDYWTVYWDVMRIVKQRFDAEGISIPYPQRDVHVYHTNLSAPAAFGN